jgi:hypothetical protein
MRSQRAAVEGREPAADIPIKPVPDVIVIGCVASVIQQ